MSDPDCIFCKIVAGDIPSDKVFENDSFLAFRDITPKAPTHILLIPKKHISQLATIADEDAGLIGRMMLAVRDIAAQEGISKNFRLVSNNGEEAGQSVFHLHLHILAGRPMSWPPG